VPDFLPLEGAADPLEALKSKPILSANNNL